MDQREPHPYLAILKLRRTIYADLFATLQAKQYDELEEKLAGLVEDAEERIREYEKRNS